MRPPRPIQRTDPLTGLDHTGIETALEPRLIGQLYLRHRTRGQVHVLALHGSLDRYTAPILRRHADPLLTREAQVEIDLANASLDPSGVAVLAQLFTTAARLGAAVEVTGSRAAVSALNNYNGAGLCAPASLKGAR